MSLLRSCELVFTLNFGDTFMLCEWLCYFTSFCSGSLSGFFCLFFPPACPHFLCVHSCSCQPDRLLTELILKCGMIWHKSSLRSQLKTTFAVCSSSKSLTRCDGTGGTGVKNAASRPPYNFILSWGYVQNVQRFWERFSQWQLLKVQMCSLKDSHKPHVTAKTQPHDLNNFIYSFNHLF